MKYLVILAIAVIAVANAQFRFRPISNPFRGFRLPSFRRPSRPRAPRVNAAPFQQPQTFTRPVVSSSSNTVSQPIITSSVSSGGNALFEIRGPSQPAAFASTSSAPIVRAPVIQSAPATALRQINGPSQPAAPASISSAPIVRAPVIQSAPATALREIPAPDMTAVASGSSSNSGSNHQWQGRSYIVSWREGRNGFTHSAARSYCRGRGMRIISLDSIQKARHFLDLVESDRAPYFWAGGQISS